MSSLNWITIGFKTLWFSPLYLLFKIFFTFNFTWICLHVVFFVYNLLEICKNSWLCGLITSVNFGKFSNICSNSCFLFFLGLQIIYIKLSYLYLRCFSPLLPTFGLFVSPCFIHAIFLYPSADPPIISSAVSKTLLNAFTEIFTYFIFFSFEISIFNFLFSAIILNPSSPSYLLPP